MYKAWKNLTFFIIFALLGTAIAVQTRTIWQYNSQKAAAVMKMEHLQAMLAQLRETGRKLVDSINETEKRKEELLRIMADKENDTYMKALIGETDKAKIEAGLTDVRGPGVVISLDDALVRTTDNPNDQLIHDVDLYRVLNVLKKAGAQAIAINGERIISASEQTCAGSTILINRKRYPVPFEISAIGDPDLMEDEFYKSSVYDDMNRYKIQVGFSKSDDVTIPKFNGDLQKLVYSLEVVKR